MAIRDMLKINRKTFVDPTGWVDYENLKYRTRTIWDVLKNLFSTGAPERSETFAEAMQRMGLTEADIVRSQQNYRLYALIFLLCGLLVFFYSFYLLFAHYTFTGWLLGIAAAGVFFSQAFRFDFWALQLRKRKLGMTYAEWKDNLLSDKRSST